MKEAKGNPGRRPIVRVLDPSRPVTSAPRELGRAAARIWEAMAPDLERLKFLRHTDVGAFARYCEHLATWWQLTRDLRKEGETYLSKSEHNPDGLYRVNPKFLIRERVEKRLEVLEDRFGLSPASRQQILHRLAMTTLPTHDGDLLKRAEQPEPTEEPATELPAAAPASPIGMLGGGRVH